MSYKGIRYEGSIVGKLDNLSQQARRCKNSLSLRDLLRAAFISHTRAFGDEPKALSNAPIVLGKCLVGSSGRRMKAKAVP
jgi:hypothetical protein